MDEAVLNIVRRELRRLSPDVQIEIEEIREKLRQEVLKRDIVEGEEAEDARKKVDRASDRRLRVKKRKKKSTPSKLAAASSTSAESDDSPLSHLLEG